MWLRLWAFGVGVKLKSLTTFVVEATSVVVETISQRIAAARQLAGVSAAHLGKLAGKSKSVVALIESGKRKGRGSPTIIAIAAALGVSTDWLLSGTGKPPSRAAVKAAIARAEVRTETK